MELISLSLSNPHPLTLSRRRGPGWRGSRRRRWQRSGPCWGSARARSWKILSWRWGMSSNLGFDELTQKLNCLFFVLTNSRQYFTFGNGLYNHNSVFQSIPVEQQVLHVSFRWSGRTCWGLWSRKRRSVPRNGWNRPQRRYSPIAKAWSLSTYMLHLQKFYHFYLFNVHIL